MATLKDASGEAANNQYRYPRLFNLEMLAFTLAALSALAMLWTVLSPRRGRCGVCGEGVI